VVDVLDLKPLERRQILYNHLRHGPQPNAWLRDLEPNLEYGIDNSHGYSAGWSPRGPYDARRFRMPVRFEHRAWYKCKYDFHVDGLRPFYIKDVVRPTMVRAPNGGALWQYGSNASTYDGYTRWKGADYKNWVPHDGRYCISVGRSRKLSRAATVLGAIISSETNRSINRQQCIEMGSRTSRHHWIFANQSLGYKSGVKVFFSW
jgi:hypothetical protein